MKRRVFMLIVFLVAGASVNVAVAWGSAFLRVGGARSEMSSQAAEASLRRAFGEDIHFRKEMPAQGLVRGRWGLETRNIIGAIGANAEVTVVVLEQVESGWPLASLRGEVQRKGSSSKESFGLVETTWSLSGRQVHIVLPTNPVWPEFAVNTIFYAAVLWLPFTAPGRIRRWRRIRRGLCAVCAYPVGASSTCTECGRPVKGT